MTEYKSRLVKELCDQLKNMPEVLAIWEGGSAATGFEDECSDLDLTIVTGGKNGDLIFAILDSLLDSQHGIARRFRVPEPSWHGMSQCVYLLQDSPEFFYCDICTVEKDNPHKLSENDRHGKARIHYDPQGLCVDSLTDPAELQTIARRVWDSATAVDFIFETELAKALHRGNYIDCASIYHTFLQRCLIPLMNLKHRPTKADFGLRYIPREYPQNAIDEVDTLLRLGSLEELKTKALHMLSMYQEIKQELQPKFQ